MTNANYEDRAQAEIRRLQRQAGRNGVTLSPKLAARQILTSWRANNKDSELYNHLEYIAS